ncbi:dispanin subfamily A member 2b-like [Denticeps clupeoides]|uniref:dispanin subfamily A member 2b-like n=1 Tax=Denticeps clupeoides TaxID=299321 RepID=UPI0010A3533A|nr:dispanin subfamily A member 2b-like [Denticeps clupeoides]
MDASKQPGAWSSDEKSGIQPPPYQDNPQLYPPPGPLYQGGYYPPGPGISPPGAYGQPYPQGQIPVGQQSTVMVQPTVYVTRTPLANPFPDYLAYSIFTMICCCLPLGIAALVYSISTRDANFQGDQHLAEKNSKTARNLNHAGLGIGLTVVIIYVICAVVLASR